MNKISHQNNTVVCYQHLSNYQCKAQHNWKEGIFLGANKNTKNKIIFSACIRYWMKYFGLPSKQELWMNCSNLPCKAEKYCFPYILCLELPHSRDIQQKQALTPSYSLHFSSLFVLLSIYPGSLEGWEMLFIFRKLLPVLLCLWFPEEWLCWVSEQLLRAGPGWRHTSLGTLSITLLAFPLRQDSYLSDGMTDFSTLSVLKYQVSELIESRWMFLQKKV